MRGESGRSGAAPHPHSRTLKTSKACLKGVRWERFQLPVLSQSSVLTTGGITNVISRKRLACCRVGDVHLNTIDFIPIPTPNGTNSAGLIDQGPLHCKFNTTAKTPARCTCKPRMAQKTSHETLETSFAFLSALIEMSAPPHSRQCVWGSLRCLVTKEQRAPSAK